MSDNETQPLLDNGKSKPDSEPPGPINSQFYVIGVILSVYYFNQAMITYVISEWIQHKVKLDVFGNSSASREQKGCEQTNHSDPAYTQYADVQEQTARWQMYNVMAGCIPVVLVLPFLPSYSDHVGRKFLFTIAFIGSVVKYTVISVAIYFELDLIWIVVALTVDAFSGGYYTVVSGASSVMADLTKRAGGSRTIGLTMLDSVMLINVTVSGVATGYIINYGGYFIPALCCGGSAFLGLLLMLTCLPESLDRRNRSSKTTVCGYLRRTFDFYGSDIFRDKRARYVLLIVAYFFEMMTTANRANIETLYQLGMPFCWGSEEIGIFAALRHAAQGFVGPLFLVPLKYCMSDLQVGIFSAISNGGSFVLEGLAANNLMLYLVSVPAIFSFLTVPMIKSIMSSLTPVDKQGSLFASIMWTECICLMATNSVSNFVYAATVSIMHGFTFFVLAGICCIVLVLLVVYGLVAKINTDTHKDVVQKNVNQSIHVHSAATTL